MPDGTIAGSTATMDRCVRVIVEQVGVPLPDAIRLASLNPAQAMGWADRLGSLAEGKEASLIALDQQLRIRMTMVKGRMEYQGR